MPKAGRTSAAAKRNVRVFIKTKILRERVVNGQNYLSAPTKNPASVKRQGFEKGGGCSDYCGGTRKSLPV